MKEYTGVQKNQAHNRVVPLQEGTPTMQNNAYKIITKGLWNRSPQRNMKVNKRPNLVPIHLSKSPTIPLNPQSL